MATARINVFCTNEELSNWLAIVASKYKLHSIWFTLQDEYSKQLNVLTEKIPAVAHRIYLMPSIKPNNRRIKFSSNEFSGVTGKNIIYGGETIYPHNLYTHQAKSLFHDKVIWKQDFLFNSVYEPFLP